MLIRLARVHELFWRQRKMKNRNYSIGIYTVSHTLFSVCNIVIVYACVFGDYDLEGIGTLVPQDAQVVRNFPRIINLGGNNQLR